MHIHGGNLDRVTFKLAFRRDTRDTPHNQTNIERGAAHIDRHQMIITDKIADKGARYRPTGRARVDDVDGVISGRLGGHRPTARLHDAHFHLPILVAQHLDQIPNIAFDDGLQISVDDSCGRALEFPELGADLRRYRNECLGIDLVTNLFHPLFVAGIEEGKEEADADRFDLLFFQVRDGSDDGGLIKRPDNFAFTPDAFFHLSSQETGDERFRGIHREIVQPLVGARSMRAISKTSRKPAVVMSPVRAPFRSSKALVPIVVPCPCTM